MNGMNISRIELLSKDNYDTWSMQVEALLIKNDLWDYVKGTKSIPVQDGESKVSWLNADKKAKADLILAIQPSELKQVRGCETSHDVWVKLESIYASKGPARKATLLKQLILQKLDENGNVKEHLSKFFDIVDKLESMQVPINGDLLSIMLLYSLPKTYENFRCAIECRDDLPSAEVLKIKIIEESEARQTTSSVVAAMAANNRMRENCKSVQKHVFKCFRCGKVGHKANVCKYKRQFSNNEQQISNQMSFAAYDRTESFTAICNMANNNANDSWVLDSGCTSHLSSNGNIFDLLDNTKNATLNLASNACADVKGKGNVQLWAKVDDRINKIELKNTLFVPDLRTNLISIAKIVDKGYRVIFSKNEAVVTDEYGNDKLRADRRGDLFYLRLNEYCGAAEIKNNDLLKWHYRLGHLNVNHMKILIKNKVLPNLKMCNINDILNCSICAKGKMIALQFDKNHEVCKETMNIIHSDVCGPFRTESFKKHRYFVTFIDECSKWARIYFLQNKSDVLQAFKDYHNWVKNQIEKPVKFLQSDNGREYINSEFTNYLSDNGIIHRTTIPYTPQQNGVAERYNRTVMDMVRCLLLQSGLSDSHWSSAVSVACYIRNRCPSNSLNGLSPYEKLFKRKPKLNHLRSFGSTVVVLDKQPNKSKLEPKGIDGIFIGYASERKGYRVWLPSERKIVECRDVRFINEKFNVTSDTSKHIDLVEDAELKNGERNFNDFISTGNKDTNSSIEINDNGGENHKNEVYVRRRGRPRINRTGCKGRPQKLYNMRSTVKNDARDNAENDTDSDTVSEAENDAEYDEQNNVENSQDDAFIDTEELYTGYAEINMATALNGSDSEEWYRAIEAEIASILKHETWKIVKSTNNTIGCRFVLTKKYLPDGKLDRYKARLVALGCSQQYGVNYKQTFAPVARLETVRLVLALSVKFDLSIWQFDIVTAYLNGDLNEEVFMRIPDNLECVLKRIIKNQSYDQQINNKAKEMLSDLKQGGNSCLLQKALYGLKQSGRMWYSKLRMKLENIGLKPTKNEPCLFIGSFYDNIVMVLIYVDDLLVASSSKHVVDNIKKQLLEDFEIKDLGLAKYCIGLEIIQNKSHILLKQENYIKQLLNTYGMSDCNPVSTPAEPTMHSHCMKNQPYTGGSYRELIGALMYLTVASRPDISNVVSRLAQFVNGPLQGHWMAAKRVLRYLAGTADKGLKFVKDNKPLLAYADADWGGCSVDRRSYSGYVFILSGAAISWKSQKQRTVALSSTEAEYISLAEAAKEAIYLRSLIEELNIMKDCNITLLVDNKGAEHLANDPVVHNRTKHIDIRFHFLRDCIKNKRFAMKHISTQQMLADVLTKPLPKVNHEKCITGIGMNK